jgi:RNA polymerase-binding transcription factor DksA
VPLTTSQRDHIERRLHEERTRALALVNEIVAERSRSSEQQAAGDLSLVPIHPADLASDRQDEDIDLANATRASAELAEIDAALERLYTSPERFGQCEDTGAPIPFERLELIPWARTCD